LYNDRSKVPRIAAARNPASSISRRLGSGSNEIWSSLLWGHGIEQTGMRLRTLGREVSALPGADFDDGALARRGQ
jgi:hypothetical protein